MSALLIFASPFVALALLAGLMIVLSHRENMAKIKMGIDPDAADESETRSHRD